MPHVPDELYRAFRDQFPLLCTDGVVIADGRILLIKRRTAPFAGHWALPGGHVEFGETTEQAVVREVLEETGVRTEVVGLVDVFSAPDRDPWGHLVSLAYLLRPSDGGDGGGGAVGAADPDEIAGVSWFALDALPAALGFDHGDMIRAALAKYPDHAHR